MNEEIFREYDIRGVAERDLTNEVVELLGKAIGTRFRRDRRERVVVGRDVRLSSTRLRDALCEGLLASGMTITDIGECPTPVLYFALHNLAVDGGVMITGSHNPAEYNGFKVAIGQSTIYGQEIQGLLEIIRKGEFVEGEGKIETRSLTERYIEEISSAIGVLSRGPRVVVDCGNGTASLAAVSIYRKLGCDVIPLFCEVDGRFPNHHPDPTVPEFLEHLIGKVKDENAELGIAFDGDSDRLGIVDHQGRIIWGDELMILYSRDILSRHPGATFIAEVKCSQRLFDDIERNGGRAIMWKAGHSLIKAKMKEEQALMAGEMSGHMFFADEYFGYDDAIYAGARLLEICSRRGLLVSELLSDLPESFSTPEIRRDCPENIKFEVVKMAQQFFSQRYPTVTVDGVRVIFEDGWGLIRASNTQPVLVLRFESKSAEGLERIQAVVEDGLDAIMEKISQSVRE
ncbi:MAG TPA: phosphomannomutase/phosphoglucomutase [Acidobacteriota bacterium]|nr:phosphomannomutase/phosphoglucomutase [Acidobacteriota bacterium]